MAVRARQSQIQQPYIPEQPPVQQPSKSPKIKRGFRITAGEKLFIFAIVVIMAALSMSILHIQGEIQTTSMENQLLQAEVATVQNENVDLKVQVGELSRYERIWKKAQELGLTLNGENVKVVPSE
ncbi:MAG: cell division protein FtsL [Lysinibacillus sp.]